MKSLKEYTANFYKKNLIYLEEAYPGIKLNRIESELESYLADHNNNANQLWPSTHFDHIVDETSALIEQFFSSLIQGIPLEYIRHRAYFYKSEFIVTPKVLIPRSETEILVELVKEEILKKQKVIDGPLRIVDIGTGSGAIILSLLQECTMPIEAVASDISRDALEVSQLNYFHLRFSIPQKSKLSFVESDLLLNVEGQFDIIVTNPPYIKKDSDLSGVHKQVNKFEPHISLYLEDATYNDWFIKLFNQAYEGLKNDGLFFMEGHENHLKNLEELLGQSGFRNTKVLKDYTQRDRFLLGTK